jgi:hypothetical protein
MPNISLLCKCLESHTELPGAGSCFTVADLCVSVITIHKFKYILQDKSALF